MDRLSKLHGDLTPEEHQAAGSAADAVRCFRLLIFVGQRVRYLLDQRLRGDGLTTQQGFLLTAVRDLGRPSLVEVAKVMATTHQNAKQVALALERKGMLRIVPDKADRRVKRIVARPASRERWESRNPEDFASIGSWFAPLTPKEQRDLASLLARLAKHLA